MCGTMPPPGIPSSLIKIKSKQLNDTLKVFVRAYTGRVLETKNAKLAIHQAIHRYSEYHKYFILLD